MSIEAQLIYDIIKIFSLENFMYVFVIFEIKYLKLLKLINFEWNLGQKMTTFLVKELLLHILKPIKIK